VAIAVGAFVCGFSSLAMVAELVDASICALYVAFAEDPQAVHRYVSISFNRLNLGLICYMWNR
jgi:hypothetical protein